METTTRRARSIMLTGAIALTAIACSNVEEDRATAAASEPADPVVLNEWVETSTSGATVTLRGATAELVAGPLPFEIEVADGSELQPRSIDLVSPSMPMHGIQRYAVEGPRGGPFHVEPVIPMEGLWALYVNLDDGADAAEFFFEVAPAAEGGGHAHMQAPSEPNSETPEHDHGGSSSE